MILDEQECLILLKNDILAIHISFNVKILLRILEFIESMKNLKKIAIDCFSPTKFQELSHDLFCYKEINNLKITEYNIDTDFICKILGLPRLKKLIINFCEIKPIDTVCLLPENHTILAFSILGNDFTDSNILPSVLYSLKRVEILYLCGDDIYKILYLINVTNFFGTRMFKKLTIISEYPDEPFAEFDFPVNVTKKLYFGRNYPEGSLKNFFSKANLNKLKSLTIHEFHIGKKDTKAFEDLDSLVYLDLLAFNFMDIAFSSLFVAEKEYKIQNLILKGANLATEDIYFISKLKMLTKLTLSNCEFENQAFKFLKQIYLTNLNLLSVDFLLSDTPEDIIEYFIEEFSLDFLSLNLEETYEEI